MKLNLSLVFLLIALSAIAQYKTINRFGAKRLYGDTIDISSIIVASGSQVGASKLLGTNTSGNVAPLSLIAGSNVTIGYSGNNVTISATGGGTTLNGNGYVFQTNATTSYKPSIPATDITGLSTAATDESNLVHKTGTETITGDKTLSGTTNLTSTDGSFMRFRTVAGSADYNLTTVSGTDNAHLQMSGGNFELFSTQSSSGAKIYFNSYGWKAATTDSNSTLEPYILGAGQRNYWRIDKGDLLMQNHRYINFDIGNGTSTGSANPGLRYEGGGVQFSNAGFTWQNIVGSTDKITIQGIVDGTAGKQFLQLSVGGAAKYIEIFDDIN